MLGPLLPGDFKPLSLSFKLELTKSEVDFCPDLDPKLDPRSLSNTLEVELDLDNKDSLLLDPPEILFNLDSNFFGNSKGGFSPLGLSKSLLAFSL